jgi:hypothetical protein
MVTAHHALAFLVIAVCALASLAALVAYRRRRDPGALTTQAIALAQTLVVAQVGLGLLLLSGHHRARDHLHYLYGTLSLAAVLAPWLYAPREPRRRLLWFGSATLLAAVLAVRAYLTAT